MKRKTADILDILEPTTIKIKEYDDGVTPLKDNSWIGSSDKVIAELSKLLPEHLPFVYCLIHEHPQLVPDSKGIPGRVQELIYLDIMKKLKNKSKRDLRLERKISKLWVENGGLKPAKSRVK